MRSIHVFAVLGLLASTAAARADDDFLKPDNWEGLKDLWKIDGTTIVGETKTDPKFNTFFCSKKKYKDFEMSFQARLKNGIGNSGVQIRSTVVDPAKFVVAGPQADMGAQYWGSLYGEKFTKEGKTGEKVSGHMMKQADFKKLMVKAGDFNDYSIKVVGKKVTIRINGVAGVDEEFPNLPEEGIIAFQIHQGFPMMEATFKDIKFKELK
jgi:Domain of Unknown Function (DUF1080)